MSFLVDPFEQTAAYRAIVAEVDRAAAAMAEEGGRLSRGDFGFCHGF